MAKAHKISGVQPLCSYRENAHIILPQKVEEVYAWEPFIRDVTRREELHNMRISIKRLRYTMEFFRIAYSSSKTDSKNVPTANDNLFTQFLTVIVDLQEILGDIHDCDVVLEVLTDYMHQSEQCVAVPGITKLIVQTKEARDADYEKFLKMWEQLSTADFKRKLLFFLVAQPIQL